MYRHHPNNTARCALIAVALTALSACGGGGGDGPQTGTLSIAVTDTPIDAGITKVNVLFTGIEVKPENGPSILFDYTPDERMIDLLRLQGEASEYLIEDEVVPAGRYLWARLHVKAEKDVHDSTVEYEGGEVYPLYIPSGAQSGLKLVSGFVVPAGGRADFVIDWNLAAAVGAPPGQDPNRFLRPALRITDRAESGVIRGTVAPELIDANNPDGCAGGNRVYLFARPDEGETAIDDMDELVDDGRAEVEASAGVSYSADRDAWEWVFGFVAPGDYTVAFTCSSTVDDSMVDDYPAAAGSEFGFAAREDVTVEVAGDSAVAF
jgi:hypothetical protein